jgi:hypothetical protein
MTQFLECLASMKDRGFVVKYDESAIPDDLKSTASFKWLIGNIDDEVFIDSIDNEDRIDGILAGGFVPSNQTVLQCYAKMTYNTHYNLEFDARSEIIKKLFDNNFTITDPRLYFMVRFCNGFNYSCQVNIKLVEKHTTIDSEKRKMYEHDITCIKRCHNTSHNTSQKVERPNNIFDKYCSVDVCGEYYDSSKLIYALQGDDLREYFDAPLV